MMKQRSVIYLIKISKVMVIKMLAKLTRIDEFSKNFNRERERKKKKTNLKKSPEAFQLLWVVLLTLITIVCFCCGIYHKIIGLDIG